MDDGIHLNEEEILFLYTYMIEFNAEGENSPRDDKPQMVREKSNKARAMPPLAQPVKSSHDLAEKLRIKSHKDETQYPLVIKALKEQNEEVSKVKSKKNSNTVEQKVPLSPHDTQEDLKNSKLGNSSQPIPIIKQNPEVERAKSKRNLLSEYIVPQSPKDVSNGLVRSNAKSSDELTEHKVPSSSKDMNKPVLTIPHPDLPLDKPITALKENAEVNRNSSRINDNKPETLVVKANRDTLVIEKNNGNKSNYQSEYKAPMGVKDKPEDIREVLEKEPTQPSSGVKEQNPEEEKGKSKKNLLSEYPVDQGKKEESPELEKKKRKKPIILIFILFQV